MNLKNEKNVIHRFWTSISVILIGFTFVIGRMTEVHTLYAYKGLGPADLRSR